MRFYKWGVTFGNTTVELWWLRGPLRFFAHTIILLALVWVFITFFMGGKFDEVCVEGRLSAEQAEVLNSIEWGHCPSYRGGTCEAEENDRVLVGQCSEFTKFIWHPNAWIRALKTEEFPWQR